MTPAESYAALRRHIKDVQPLGVADKISLRRNCRAIRCETCGPQHSSFDICPSCGGFATVTLPHPHWRRLR
jgi:rRNA maturation endonuclease Nob1